MSHEQIKLTWNEVMNYDSQFVFRNTVKDEIYTKTKLKQLIKKVQKFNKKCPSKMIIDVEDYKQKIASVLIPTKAYFIREGRKHHMSCEFGHEDGSCVCWCGEKYHGFRCMARPSTYFPEKGEVVTLQ